ncbi:MAG TPA: PKD domain-containing protein [Catalimonadaceae bacterium]|nr:PKD domain-containing protein [Catalimonadaceae bacterium]
MKRLILTICLLAANFIFRNPVFAHSHTTSYFIENRGQWPSHVRFMTDVPGGHVWFGPSSFRTAIQNPALPHGGNTGKKMVPVSSFGHAYDLVFTGGHAKRISTIGHRSETRFNYYLSSNPKEWCSGAAGFEEIRYEELYPGVNARVYHQGDAFKYDLEASKASNIEKVSIEYKGLNGIQLQDGKLRLQTSVGVIEESIPVAWQMVDGRKKEIPCVFVLNGNKVRFRFPKGYDPELPLVIDPQFVFYTYSGGFSDNWGNTAIGDKFGNSYLAGTVYGPAFPATLGAFDTQFNGEPLEGSSTYDIGIQKFSPDGSQLLACTFLGGSEADTPHSINIDDQNNLLVFGTTSSLDFPTSSTAFQRLHKGGSTFHPLHSVYVSFTYNNGADLFITKLSGNGNSLIASTFLGGSQNDGNVAWSDSLYANYGDSYRGDIATAPDGSILVASCTYSSNFPVQNAHQSVKSKGMDGIVFRLSPDLDQLIWSTFLGGGATDAFYSIQVQGANRVVVCGGTKSKDFPMTPNAYQGVSTIGQSVPFQRLRNTDAVIASFNLETGSLMHSTFYGSTSYDQAYLVQTDSEGNVYILGQTEGIIPRTAGTYGSNGGKVFLAKLNPDLDQRIWATSLGSNTESRLVPSAFMVDSCGRLYFSGWGGESNDDFIGGFTLGFPTTTDAYKPSTDGSDFYFGVLSSDATSLQYGTFFGGPYRGEHVDGGMSRFDKSGTITQAICGCTSGNNFFNRGSIGSYSPTIKSTNCNQSVVKFNLGVLESKFNLAAQIECGKVVTLSNLSSNGTNYTWFWGNGDSLKTNSNTVTYSYPQAGTYIITLKAENPTTCKKIDFFTDTIVLTDPFNFPVDTIDKEFCKGDKIQPVLPAHPGISQRWLPNDEIINNNLVNPILAPVTDKYYTIENRDNQGCIRLTYYHTIPKSDLILRMKDSLQLRPCESQATLFLNGIGNGSEYFHWTVNQIHYEGEQVIIPLTTSQNMPVVLKGMKNTCPDSVSKMVEIPPFQFTIQSAFSFSQVMESCEEKVVNFTNSSAGFTSAIWDFGDGQTSTETDPAHQYEKAGLYKVKLTSSNEKCSSVMEKDIQYSPAFIPNLITKNADGRNDLFDLKEIGQGISLDVFDRWGGKVFSSSSYINDFSAHDMEPGVYFFLLKFPGGKSCRSWLEVVK